MGHSVWNKSYSEDVRSQLKYMVAEYYFIAFIKEHSKFTISFHVSLPITIGNEINV